MSKFHNSNLLDVLRESLPPVLWRHKWKEYQDKYGIPFCRGTLANADSQGRGPVKGLMAGKIYYLKEEFLSWLQGRNLDD